MSIAEAVERVRLLQTLTARPVPPPAPPAAAAPAASFATRLAAATPGATPAIPGATPAGPGATAAPAPAGALVGVPPALAPLVRRAAAEAGVDPALVAAVAQAESGFNPSAGSPAGAQGLMQLMPGTARALGVSDPHDPAQSLRGGARYLRQQLDAFGGDVRLALAAYNAGPGAVRRHGGVPPYAETEAYVPRVLGFYDQLRAGAAAA